MKQNQADFSERLVAFMIDGLLFTGAFFLAVKASDLECPVLANPNGRVLFPAFLAAFVLYHMVLSSGGRVTLGKGLLGLRVISDDGEPLDMGTSTIRSIGYLASSLLNIGFLWSLIHPQGKAWHDLLAGSRVIRIKTDRSFGRQLFVSAGAVVSIAILAGTWGWQNIGAPKYYNHKIAQNGVEALKELGQMQEIYKQAYGRYADTLHKLARESGDAERYSRSVFMALDPAKEFKITANRNSYQIIAHARDINSTRLVYPQ